MPWWKEDETLNIENPDSVKVFQYFAFVQDVF